MGYAYLAIGFAENGSGLWPHYFRKFSPKALTVALHLASDESLPSEARRNLLYHAANSYVLKHPLNTTNYSVMPKQELLDAQVRLAELQQQLGVES